MEGARMRNKEERVRVIGELKEELEVYRRIMVESEN